MPGTVKELMSSKPCSIDSDKPIAYAAQMMRDEDVGLAPIVEGDKLVGVLTDRDIAVRVVAEGKDPEQTRVSEIASSEVVAVEPEQDLDGALRLMALYQVRRLPVVEQSGRLVGVLAQADVARRGDERTTGTVVEEISKEAM
jgi:CBS domain-containing protein